MAGRARLRVLRLDRPLAVAHLACSIALIGDASAGALLGRGGVEREVEDDVGANARVIRARAPARGGAARVAVRAKGKAPAKGVSPTVAVAAGIGRAGGASRAREGRARAHGVVAGALLGVREDGVSLRDLLELLLCVRCLVDVGVKLAGLLLEGLADVFCRGVLVDAEDCVVVLVVHRSHAKSPAGCVGGPSMGPTSHDCSRKEAILYKMRGTPTHFPRETKGRSLCLIYLRAAAERSMPMGRYVTPHSSRTCLEMRLSSVPSYLSSR